MSLIVKRLAVIQFLAWFHGPKLGAFKAPRDALVRRLREAQLSPRSIEQRGDRMQCVRCDN
eukprot:3402029-Pyramimonas_sp.AAC.1